MTLIDQSMLENPLQLQLSINRAQFRHERGTIPSPYHEKNRGYGTTKKITIKIFVVVVPYHELKYGMWYHTIQKIMVWYHGFYGTKKQKLLEIKK